MSDKPLPDATEDPSEEASAGSEQEGKKPEAKQPRWRGWIRDIAFLALVALVSMAARSVLADHYHVPSGSMRPTVQVGDRLVVNKLAYGLRFPFTKLYIMRFDDPAHGDVVVLKSPEDGVTLLKRIVAVPGDVVEVRDGRLTLNGNPVETDDEDGTQYIEHLGAKIHAIRITARGGPQYGPVELPEDKFLVMGDNRGQSRDGRMFGLVERRTILGRGIAVYRRHGKFVWVKL